MKPLAALLAILLAWTARADEVHLEAIEPPPEKSAVVVWHFQNTEVLGLWVTEEQSRRISAELNLCREEAKDMQRALVPWWGWVVAGALVGGGGVYLAKH